MACFDVCGHINPPKTPCSYDFSEIKILDLTIVKPHLSVAKNKKAQKYWGFRLQFSNMIHDDNTRLKVVFLPWEQKAEVEVAEVVVKEMALPQSFGWSFAQDLPWLKPKCGNGWSHDIQLSTLINLYKRIRQSMLGSNASCHMNVPAKIRKWFSGLTEMVLDSKQIISNKSQISGGAIND